MFFVYILKCADGTFYIGKTLNLEERIAVHNGKGRNGAKYTRSRRPVTLKYYETFQVHKQAAQREIQLKKLSREEKEKLMADG